MGGSSQTQTLKDPTQWETYKWIEKNKLEQFGTSNGSQAHVASSEQKWEKAEQWRDAETFEHTNAIRRRMVISGGGCSVQLCECGQQDRYVYKM